MFQKYLIKVSVIHSHNTRYASNYGKHTFKFAITKIWEEILTNTKTLGYHQFKKQYKRILLTLKVDYI